MVCTAYRQFLFEFVFFEIIGRPLAPPAPWSLTCQLYFLRIHTRLKARVNTKGSCEYQENTSDTWDIPRYTTGKRCITGIYLTQSFSQSVSSVRHLSSSFEIECTFPFVSRLQQLGCCSTLLLLWYNEKMNEINQQHVPIFKNYNVSTAVTKGVGIKRSQSESRFGIS